MTSAEQQREQQLNDCIVVETETHNHTCLGLQIESFMWYILFLFPPMKVGINIGDNGYDAVEFAN